MSRISPDMPEERPPSATGCPDQPVPATPEPAPDPPLSTGDLTRRAQAGDRGAREQLFERVEPALWVWAMARVGPKLRRQVDAGDIVNETWVRVFERFGRFDPQRGSFRMWAFGIANNVLLEHLRNLKAVATGSALSNLTAGSTSPGSRAANEEIYRRQAEIIVREVEALDAVNGRILAMDIQDPGRPNQEIASALEIAVGTVYARRSRLRERFRNAVIHLYDD